jgi:hypothetical protein
MSTTFNALAFNITALREQGILKRVRGTPLPTSAYLAGIAGSAVTNTVPADPHHHVLRPPAVRPRLAAGLVLAVAVRDRRRDLLRLARGVAVARDPELRRAPAYVNAAFLPLIFISGVFYDENVAPVVIRRRRPGAAAQAPDRRAPGVDRHRPGRRPPPRRVARARRLGGGRSDAGDPGLLLGVPLDLRRLALARQQAAWLGV